MKLKSIPWSTVRTICSMFLTLLFQVCMYYVAHSQTGRVGIGTSQPMAKLHIAGNLIIDSIPNVSDASYLLTRDSLGIVAALSIDSFKQELVTSISTSIQTIYGETVANGSTTANTPQTRVSLLLPVGTYLVFAYAEIHNTTIDAGVRMWFFQGTQETAYSIIYSNTSTFGSWNTFRMMTVTSPITVSLAYSSWPGGTTSFIRRARIVALKIG